MKRILFSLPFFASLLTSAALLEGCGTDESPDVGADAGFDAGVDAGFDAGPTDPIIRLVSYASVEKYTADLSAVSIPRPAGTINAKAVRGMIADRLNSLGYEVDLQDYGTGVNVVGVKKGDDPARVLFTAHYDAFSECPGADDNGSGTAGVLEAARLLSAATFKKTAVFVFFDQEELGLIGSEAYAAGARQRGDNILMVFNMDMIGYVNMEPGSQEVPQGLDLLFPDQADWLKRHKYIGDFIIYCLNSAGHDALTWISKYSKELGLLHVDMELPEGMEKSDILEQLRRGDHAPFWMNDYPAMMLNDANDYRKGNPYHCYNGLVDSPDKVDADFALKVVQSASAAGAAMLEMK